MSTADVGSWHDIGIWQVCFLVDSGSWHGTQEHTHTGRHNFWPIILLAQSAELKTGPIVILFYIYYDKDKLHENHPKYTKGDACCEYEIKLSELDIFCRYYHYNEMTVR